MNKAKVKSIELDVTTREIKILVSAKDSEYVMEPKGYGFPSLVNGAPLIEGLNYVLEFGHVAIDAMKTSENFPTLVNENRKLREGILNSNLAARCRQFLSSIDYGTLTDFQAKCALLLEKELKA